MTAAPLSWDLATAARVCGGATVGDEATAVGCVITDSRDAGPGALFVALRGERHDGHRFAPQAMAAGAAACVVEVHAGATVAPRIEVGDTAAALLALAVHHRDEIGATVVAITGSTGKTSTKDMLAAALGPGAAASRHSFNNEVGVPLTVLATHPARRYLVAEVGSRGVGHISMLAPAVRPDVAVITNIGVVHLATFGTKEAVVAAKWELVESLGAGGTAVLPDDDRRLHRPHPGATLLFGERPEADVRLSAVAIREDGTTSFRLDTPAGSGEVRLAMAGARQPWNAAAATAAALAAGRELDDVFAGLEKAAASAWRMDVRRGRFTVVNDAYNANPDSMATALRTVAVMPGRRLAVLGLMAELGPVAVEEHVRIGRLAADLGFDPVIVVGDEPGLARGAGDVAVTAADPEEAMAMVLKTVTPGDVVLVKASRAAGLETLATSLIEEAAR